MKKLSIIIPAYNEERTIAQILAKVQAVNLGDIQKEIVVVVDNNSTDNTGKIARSIPGVRVLEERTPGKGAAVKRGFAEAIGDMLLIQDADLEYEPEDYPAMIAPILNGNTEATLGIRIEERHRDNNRFVISFLGGLGNFAITTLTNILYWNNAGEYEGCYKAFTKRLIDSIPVAANGFDYDNELVCKLLKRGYKTVDVPIHYYPRSYAEGKKITWKHGFKILWTILKTRFID
ncbi:MAG: glycosyltransferase family 2 protein [Minisyncoccia bacterium]